MPALFRLLSDDLRRTMLIEIAVQPWELSELAEALGIDESIVLDTAIALQEFGVIEADRRDGTTIFRAARTVSGSRTAEQTILRVDVESGEQFELHLSHDST